MAAFCYQVMRPSRIWPATKNTGGKASNVTVSTFRNRKDPWFALDRSMRTHAMPPIHTPTRKPVAHLQYSNELK
jgi:hypothetical protein